MAYQVQRQGSQWSSTQLGDQIGGQQRQGGIGRNNRGGRPKQAGQGRPVQGDDDLPGVGHQRAHPIEKRLRDGIDAAVPGNRDLIQRGVGAREAVVLRDLGPHRYDPVGHVAVEPVGDDRDAGTGRRGCEAKEDQRSQSQGRACPRGRRIAGSHAIQ